MDGRFRSSSHLGQSSLQHATGGSSVHASPCQKSSPLSPAFPPKFSLFTAHFLGPVSVRDSHGLRNGRLHDSRIGPTLSWVSLESTCPLFTEKERKRLSDCKRRSSRHRRTRASSRGAELLREVLTTPTARYREHRDGHRASLRRAYLHSTPEVIATTT